MKNKKVVDGDREIPYTTHIPTRYRRIKNVPD
ncbi:hypothetical protein [Escherichia phage FL38]